MVVELKGRKLFLSIIDSFTKVSRWISIAAATCLGLAMLIGTIEVISTKFFNWPLPGSTELIEELNVGISLLAIAAVAMLRGHIRITILEHYMPKVLSFFFVTLSYVFGILLSALITWRTFVLLQTSIENQVIKGASMLGMPVWPGNLVCLIGFALLLVAFVLLLCKQIIIRQN
jgi:TRAP-type C4-dicarboxylate transport system permease small subunit